MLPWKHFSSHLLWHQEVACLSHTHTPPGTLQSALQSVCYQRGKLEPDFSQILVDFSCAWWLNQLQQPVWLLIRNRCDSCSGPQTHLAGETHRHRCVLLYRSEWRHVHLNDSVIKDFSLFLLTCFAHIHTPTGTNLRVHLCLCLCVCARVRAPTVQYLLVKAL